MKIKIIAKNDYLNLEDEMNAYLASDEVKDKKIHFMNVCCTQNFLPETTLGEQYQIWTGFVGYEE